MTHQTYDLAVTTTDIMGADVEDVIVHAELIDFSDGSDIMGSSFDDTMILPSVKSAMTDENGEATLSLVPTSNLLPAAKYRILLTKGPRQFCYQISMPAANTDLMTEVRREETEPSPQGIPYTTSDRDELNRLSQGAVFHRSGTATYSAADALLTVAVSSGAEPILGDSVYFQLPDTIDDATDDLDLLVTWSGGSFREGLLNSDLTPVIADELVPLSVVQAFRFHVSALGGRRWVLIEPTDLTNTQAQDATNMHFGLVSGEVLAGAVQAHSTGSGSTDLSIGTRTGTTLVVESSSGTNATLPEATDTEAGLLSGADHAVIGGIPDPSSATDGQVIKVDSGAYVIGDDEQGSGTGTDSYIDGLDISASGTTITIAGEYSDSKSDISDTLTLAASNIPDLAASKITSGEFDADRIPNLAASKITTGEFADDRIPDLNASKTTAGTFDTDRIPNLNASKINAGEFDDDRIPDLNASKITAGTFNSGRIPNLNASKINAGTLAEARLPDGTIVLDPSSATDGQVAKVDGGAWVIGDDETASGTGATDLSIGTRTGTTLVVESSSGNDVTLPEASNTEAGLLSGADHTTISGISTTYAPLAGADFTGGITIAESTADSALAITQTGNDHALTINQSQNQNSLRITQTGNEGAVMVVQNTNQTALEVQTPNNTNEPAFKLITASSGDRKGFQITNDGQGLAWASFEYAAGGNNKPGFALGSGAGGRDVNLYREGTNMLRTDDALTVGDFTTTTRNALTSPVAGTVIWNTTTTQLEVYNGTAWAAV